ncbi:type II glyceraldehyde-3-phosphate dehydrogenase [Infirmifilum sp. NZ]|uniref:type II glyceraldehyde-3-phosphate dehydrogenase n=1 Tax=Infirmifilum sp. NZ TaxID=2926850 RepID=UPI00279D7801|nr:type II glyceraldehyde-3-phosphate dehydrogenase [Infirmifilum sp. NZ]UNQ73305.1 type II glyceraldehyde-3-phosphate dehydrogenase [Infirmifilum sp. NZ]
MIRVSVNGYGTIGKRVAWAVSRMPDMELVGVSKTRPDWEAALAVKNGFRLFVPDGYAERFEEAGIKPSGSIEEMIAESDIVVDATPSGVGARYKPVYEAAGKRAVFQGGEKPDVAEASFFPLVNYSKALGKRYLRVLSCNTTGLARVIYALSRVGELRRVYGVIVRRGADPKEVSRGPIEGLLLESLPPPSHHSRDLAEIFPNIEVLTYAVVAPTTLSHLHIIFAEFREPVSASKLVESLHEAPRVLVLDDSIRSTAELRELARYAGRPLGDIYEVAVWEDSVAVKGATVSLAYAVHQEAVVIPENVDAVRASMSTASEAADSILLTDRILGVKSWL